MRVVALSDLHGFLPTGMPEGDLLLLAGDIVPDNFSYEGESWTRQEQAAWARSEFTDWLGDQPYRKIIGIGGNHDFIFDGKLPYTLPWTYLQDEATEFEGLKIWGSPMTPTFGGWAFMRPERELLEHWDKIPEDVNILMTHGPAYGTGDLIPGIEGAKYGMAESQRVGSSTLRHKLEHQYPNLKMHVYGHIHSARGREDWRGIISANVSHVNDLYKPVNHPMVFDLD